MTLIFFTGIIWGGIGILLGMASRRKIDELSFMALGTGMSAILAWVFITDWSVLVSGQNLKLWGLCVLLGTAGTYRSDS